MFSLCKVARVCILVQFLQVDATRLNSNPTHPPLQDLSLANLGCDDALVLLFHLGADVAQPGALIPQLCYALEGRRVEELAFLDVYPLDPESERIDDHLHQVSPDNIRLEQRCFLHTKHLVAQVELAFIDE